MLTVGVEPKVGYQVHYFADVKYQQDEDPVETTVNKLKVEFEKTQM